jgi:hypothetical protein
MYMGLWWGNQQERDLENVDVDGMIILKLILEKWNGSIWTY